MSCRNHSSHKGIVRITADNNVPKNLVAFDIFSCCFGYAYTFYSSAPLTQRIIEDASSKVDGSMYVECRVHSKTLDEYNRCSVCGTIIKYDANTRSFSKYPPECNNPREVIVLR